MLELFLNNFNFNNVQFSFDCSVCGTVEMMMMMWFLSPRVLSLHHFLTFYTEGNKMQVKETRRHFHWLSRIKQTALTRWHGCLAVKISVHLVHACAAELKEAAEACCLATSVEDGARSWWCSCKHVRFKLIKAQKRHFQHLWISFYCFIWNLRTNSYFVLHDTENCSCCFVHFIYKLNNKRNLPTDWTHVDYWSVPCEHFNAWFVDSSDCVWQWLWRCKVCLHLGKTLPQISTVENSYCVLKSLQFSFFNKTLILIFSLSCCSV